MRICMDLSGQELSMLQGVLEREIATTRTELRRTDDHDYRQQVSDQMETLEHTLNAVLAAEESADLTIG